MQLDELVVLLVEGSTTQQKIIRGALRELGVRDVTLVASGEQALVRLAESPPDLVISAMYLEDMTGTDLVHRMRTTEAWQDIAFMLISSVTDIRVLDPIRQAGAIAILPKMTFETAALRRALYSTLDYYEPCDQLIAGRDPEDLAVLLVDDSQMARRYIRRVLQSFGVEQVDEAVDGHQACELLAERFYDVVLTDYNMPGMNGHELLEHIRQHSNQPSMPVLMVTSEEDEGRLVAVEQAGVSAICDKPFEPGTARALLDAVLRAAG